jgi:hypothetical protein
VVETGVVRVWEGDDDFALALQHSREADVFFLQLGWREHRGLMPEVLLAVTKLVQDGVWRMVYGVW